MRWSKTSHEKKQIHRQGKKFLIIEKLDGYLGYGGVLAAFWNTKTRMVFLMFEKIFKERKEEVKLRHSFLHQYYREKMDTITKALYGFTDNSIEIDC